MNTKTFGQYLVESKLPSGMEVDQPLDKKNLEAMLKEVARNYESQYSQIVSDLKRLGDKLSTLDGISYGINEIEVPNREKRNAIIQKYKPVIEDNSKSIEERLPAMMDFQKEFQQMERDPSLQDDASELIRSSMGGKANQQMKLRIGPGLVGNHRGEIVPEVLGKSYAEGQDVLGTWLGAAEARTKLAEGQVQTSAPGELNKVISNVMNRSVVSQEDCETQRGIELATRDSNIIGRYFARNTGNYRRNTKVTNDTQQDLLNRGIDRVLVRSPQTCQSKDQTVCRKCMGSRPSTGKDYEIGDNAGMISAGALSEPMTQMTLSAKHGTSLAEEKKDLEGEKGFRKTVELSDSPRRQIICEVYGEVAFIWRASQGGFNLIIRETQRVPERFIKRAKPDPQRKRHWIYYINPQLELAEDIQEGTQVYPGMELTDGFPNIEDVARLRGLGAARSTAAENMHSVYKNTGVDLDRKHFELLSRNAHPYVKIEKAPENFPFKRGEMIELNQFENLAKNYRAQNVNPDDSLGMTLAEGVADLTPGTKLYEPEVNRLKRSGVNQIRATNDFEVSPATFPMTRVVNNSDDWIANLNHRFLKDQIKQAGALGKKSKIHGHSPMSAYAYGVEFGRGPEGRY